MIDYTRAFVLYLIQHAKRTLTKTTLMKMVYLADVEHYRRTGQQLTGLRWRKDNFGPVDYRVLQHVEGMEKTGQVLIQQVGTSARYFFANCGTMFLGDSWREMGDFVIDAYSEKPFREILDIAYATEPMTPKPAMGEYLDFSRVKRYDYVVSQALTRQPQSEITAFERKRLLDSVITSQACEGITVPRELAEQWLDEVMAERFPQIFN